MPLKPGKSKAVISSNISEFHKGPTFQKTAAKFGKAKADKQAVAVAFSQARRSGKGQGKEVGCGHASCMKVGKGCSMGKGQSKSVGKGQGAVPPTPPRKPRGAMPLKQRPRARHPKRPAMAAMQPGGGGPPMGPPMLPGAGVNGTPGLPPQMPPPGGPPQMPPARPPLPPMGMGQARKPKKTAKKK